MSTTTVTLPTWTECSMAMKGDDYNILHEFIFENEPADEESAEEFREKLEKVLEWHLQQVMLNERGK